MDAVLPDKILPATGCCIDLLLLLEQITYFGE